MWTASGGAPLESDVQAARRAAGSPGPSERRQARWPAGCHPGRSPDPQRPAVEMKSDERVGRLDVASARPIEDRRSPLIASTSSSRGGHRVLRQPTRGTAPSARERGRRGVVVSGDRPIRDRGRAPKVSRAQRRRRNHTESAGGAPSPRAHLAAVRAVLSGTVHRVAQSWRGR